MEMEVFAFRIIKKINTTVEVKTTMENYKMQKIITNIMANKSAEMENIYFM